MACPVDFLSQRLVTICVMFLFLVIRIVRVDVQEKCQVKSHLKSLGNILYFLMDKNKGNISYLYQQLNLTNSFTKVSLGFKDTPLHSLQMAVKLVGVS